MRLNKTEISLQCECQTNFCVVTEHICVFQAHLTVEESVSGLLTVLSNLTESDHGGFKDYRGDNLPW